MRRFFSTRIVHSEKNGEIVIRNWFGTPAILVQGFFQSGPYMQALWRSAVRRVPADTRVERVLMLGLAGGSAITEIHQRFPNVNITVIEWDSAMVEIARELKFFADRPEPDIVIGDAVELVPQLTTKYDLVLIDLFMGETPEPILSSPEWIDSLVRVLNPDGHLVLNAFKSWGLIEDFAQHADHQVTWRFRYNRLALYKAFP